MEPKEYYLAVIAIIDFVFEGNETVTAEKGVELAGAYWPRIFSEFSSLKLGVPISNGDFRFTRTVFLAPVREDCMHALEEIAKREEDRDLDNKSKKRLYKAVAKGFCNIGNRHNRICTDLYPPSIPCNLSMRNMMEATENTAAAIEQ